VCILVHSLHAVCAPAVTDETAHSRASIVAHNLRRLMARHALTYDDVVECTGLDERTLRGILHAKKRPHARTLTRLAEGLRVDADELFVADPAAARAEFDAATNPAIQATLDASPELFAEWTPAEFGELASRVGVGGAMTEEGVRAAAAAMNANRRTLRRVRVLLESDHADALRTVIDAMYQHRVAGGGHSE